MSALKQILTTVSSSSGVYLMQDGAGTTLYVGKAKNLKKRLASYLRASEGGKTGVMLAKVKKIETIQTGTENESLLLEASLIKKHRPRYNVILRDDKNYPMIKVTVQETWPRVFMSRQRSRDGARYFGPFSSSSAMWETLNHLNALFPLRRCKGREVKSRERPCLNFQMGRCPGPCTGKADPKAYQEAVRNVILALEGRNRLIIEELTVAMNQAALALAYEKAARCRDLIRAMETTLEKQVMVAGHCHDQDVFGFVRHGVSVAIGVVAVRSGAVCGHHSFFLAEPWGEDDEVLSQVLERFYEEADFVPQDILLPFAPAGLESLASWLCGKKEKKVNLLMPQRGDRLTLLQMATANAGQMLVEKEKKEQSWQVLGARLQQDLHLSRVPERIECLDISNLGAEQPVGSLVCFFQGEKDGGGYRHYHIRTVAGPDDYAMMAEVLHRRFREPKENESSPGGKELPDLFLVDGGKGQLNVARQVLREKGLEGMIDLAGIAKEKEGEGEKLFRPGRKNPIIPARHAPSLLFLMRVRDEAHRYGITFHRRLRRKDTVKSELDLIPGIGPARRCLLLKELGSMKKIKEATLEELARLPGLGPELAEVIFRYLHPA